MKNLDIELFGKSVVFRSQPESIPGDFRPLWRICVVILFLRLASIGNKASLSKIHVLNWAIHTKENRENLLKVINEGMRPDLLIVRVEPSLNRAIEFAHGEGLIERRTGNKIQLTARGIHVADQLFERDDLLVEEKKFLNALGKNKLTENMIGTLFREGRR